MPEIPEIEVLKRSLAAEITGKKINGVEVFWNRITKNLAPDELRSKIANEIVEGVQRKGKAIVLNLSGFKNLAILLRSTGKLVFDNKDEPWKRFSRLSIIFEDGRSLKLVDPKRLAGIYLVSPDDKTYIEKIQKIGAEPLSSSFTLGIFKKLIVKKKTKLGNLLKDNRVIGGLGNIYASEILFSASINPERTPDTLSEEEVRKLYYSIFEVLQKSIFFDGSSFNGFIKLDGSRGHFQRYLHVYGRGGKPCQVCRNLIQRKEVGKQYIYYCPVCQK